MDQESGRESYSTVTTSTGNDMATFHPFPRLPAQLRAMVWQATLVPRVVDVGRYSREFVIRDHLKRGMRPGLSSSTPVPAILHACREARHLGAYQRAFSELDIVDGDEPQYIWVNFAVDMIHIRDDSRLSDFEPVAPLIQKLKFSPPYGNGIISETRCDIRRFTNLKEFHTVCTRFYCHPHFGAKDVGWPCGWENVFVYTDDKTERAADIQREKEEARRDRIRS